MSDTLETTPRASFVRRFGSNIARARPDRVGLRTRILLTFAVGFFVLSTFLAAITYSFTRSTLVDEHDRTSVSQAYRNASVALNDLRSGPASAQPVIDTLSGLGIARPLLNYRDVWTAGAARFGPEAVPRALRDRVLIDAIPSRMIVTGSPLCCR